MTRNMRAIICVYTLLVESFMLILYMYLSVSLSKNASSMIARSIFVMTDLNYSPKTFFVTMLEKIQKYCLGAACAEVNLFYTV